MSSLGSPNPFFIAGKKAYEVQRSLRFNSGDSTSLTRTPSSTTNRRTYTFSFWFKLGNTGVNYLFEVGDSDVNNNRLYIRIDSDSAISIGERDVYRFITTQRIRDFSAWYHLVFAVDTTLSTADNRMRLYLNGEEITSFSTRNNFSQNQDTGVNRNHITNWGRSDIDSHYAGVYFAEINFIDGFQYDPSYFGQTDAITGQWNPKKYIGSYGTNGYYLNFSDNSGTTATTLGKDSSGNGNNFTPNNFGTGDAVKDSPTNNFCTLNSINDSKAGTVSEGNLRYTGGSGNGTIASTFGISPSDTKGYYFEGRIISGNEANRLFFGIGLASTNWINVDARGAGNGDSWVLRNGDGAFLNNQSHANDNGATSVGQILQIAVKGSKIWVGTNNTWHASGDPAAGSNEKFSNITDTWTPVLDLMTSNVFQFNFGQDSSFSNTVTAQGNTDANGNGDFYYSPPTGFFALCSKNLPDPTILDPTKHFNTLLYSGNGSDNRDITGLNFAPDWVWLKRRDGSMSNNLGDTVRGTDKILFSDQTAAENTETDRIKAYNSDGFRLGTDSAVNFNGYTYVAWNWDAGETDSATYTVKVVSDSGNKYRFNNFGTSAVTLDLAEGGTYTFDQSDSSMSSHPMQLSTTANGTHGGGSAYSTGVTYELDGSTVTASAFISGFSSASSRKLIITVAASAPTLYYYCYYHSGMGGQANTNSTLGSSNFAGSIQSTVKANTTAGFSIVTWTGNGSSGATIGHGLGVTPNFAIAKNRSSSANWPAVNFDLQTGGQLNTNQTFSNGNYNAYYAGQPSSSVLTLGSHGTTNTNGDNYVAYVFSEVSSYSKFGSYVGNGNSDGVFVFTGFRPAFVLFKYSSGSAQWNVRDIARDTDNPTEKYLVPSTNGAEGTSSHKIDFLSNGFKHRGTGAAFNSNGGTYIYLAFAESPFKNARAR